MTQMLINRTKNLNLMEKVEFNRKVKRSISNFLNTSGLKTGFLFYMIVNKVWYGIQTPSVRILTWIDLFPTNQSVLSAIKKFSKLLTLAI